MAFPWKKVKSAKISRFVNDHLHNSQKRRDGSSLVVETGFPTSLIDLFIKNREKLRKPSKKKRLRIPDLPLVDVNDQVISRSQTPCPSPLPSPVDESVVLYHFLSYCPSPSVSECTNVIDGVDDRRETGVDANGVLLAVLKLFLVVVLALVFKRLTVGITLSAFLLFFLDCVGKRLSGFLKPCFESKVVLRLVESMSRFVEMKKEDESSLPIQEIEIVEPEVDLVSGEEEFRFENEFRRLGDQDTELKEVVAKKDEFLCGGGELNRRKSRKEKMKSKMKKLVPKKLRKIKKGEHSVESLEIFSKDSVDLSGELEADQCKDEKGSEIVSSLSSSVPSGRFNEENFVIFPELTEVNVEAAKKWGEGDGKKKEFVPIRRYLALGLIVLVGLIGGRALALLLTLSWCLLLKFGETIQRYIKKVSIIRSFIDKSG